MNNNRTTWIVLLILLLIICCCCALTWATAASSWAGCARLVSWCAEVCDWAERFAHGWRLGNWTGPWSGDSGQPGQRTGRQDAGGQRPGDARCECAGGRCDGENRCRRAKSRSRARCAPTRPARRRRSASWSKSRSRSISRATKSGCGSTGCRPPPGAARRRSISCQRAQADHAGGLDGRRPAARQRHCGRCDHRCPGGRCDPDGHRANRKALGDHPRSRTSSSRARWSPMLAIPSPPTWAASPCASQRRAPSPSIRAAISAM